MKKDSKFKAAMAKIKPDMNNKKTNIIITAVCMALALIVTIISAIQFTSFRLYKTEFVLREGVVDEVIKFHEYSKYLKGTQADSEIYVINGTENIVALVKADKAQTYAQEIPATAKTCVAAENGTRVDVAKAGVKGEVAELELVSQAVAGVVSGEYDAALMRHEDAKAAVKANGALQIAKTTVEEVPSLLVIGGTHPNEPSGQLAATLFLENANVERGILYVITELNKSAYSHSQPQEATSWYYSFEVGGTERKFKYGSRATNTVDQWPTPDVYTHSSGQQLSSSEVRNINRAYPGSETGTFTEKIAWVVTNFVLQNNVTMVIDLHEASPEYSVINAMVYHQDSGDLAATAINNFFPTIYDDLKSETSALGLHGLTHRELGDFTAAYVFLFETSNASQGKIRGKFTEDLILYENYTDKFYEAAAAKGGLLYAPPVAIRERVARHTESIMSIVDAYNVVKQSRSSFEYTKMDNPPETGKMLGELIINNIPTYAELAANGVQGYLLPSER